MTVAGRNAEAKSMRLLSRTLISNKSTALPISIRTGRRRTASPLSKQNCANERKNVTDSPPMATLGRTLPTASREMTMDGQLSGTLSWKSSFSKTQLRQPEHGSAKFSRAFT